MWVLIFLNVVLVAGYALSLPFFAIYLNVYKGISIGVVGTFLACAMLITSFARALGGEWSDIIGRKRVMIIALFCEGIFIAFMAWIIKTDGHWVWLIPVHILRGFSGGFFGPAARGWVADFMAPAKRMRAYGLLRIGTNLGWAMGVLLGTLGIQFLSPMWAPAPWCFVGIMAAAAGAGFWSLRGALTDHEDGKWDQPEGEHRIVVH